MSAEEGRGTPLEEVIEQVLAERRRGGFPDLNAVLRRHPEYAQELQELLPALELLERARDRAPDPHEEGRDASPEPAVSPPSERRKDSAQLTEVLDRLAGRAAFFARYELRDEIGRGGQGAVLAVWDEDLHRSLAMKRLLGPGKESPSAVEPRSLGRFLDEAQVTAQLDHPGIVPVHELGVDPSGGVYFTMKLVKGRDLRTIFGLVRRGEEGWTRTRALSVMLKVCEAMAYAHDKGVIHRDLKPSNVMVGRYGEAYVMDWGLARILGSQDKKDLRIRPERTGAIQSVRHESSAEPDSPLVTMDGDVVGTPAYMSPEQARGEVGAMGPQSDVYAVGAMLYELLTGHMPYVPDGSRLSNREVWALVQQGPPTPLEQIQKDIPAELATICERAMAREPERRYRDTLALGEDLQAYLEHRVVKAYETGALAELRKWVGRNKPLAAALGSVFLAVVAGMIVSLVFKTRADERADDVLRLSALQDLEDLTAEADRLWPAYPQNVERYREWLRKAEELVASLPEHEAKLVELRVKALPWTEADQTRQRATHSKAGELEREKRHLEFLRTLVKTRDSEKPVRDPTAQEVGADLEALPATAAQMNELAWPLVDPARKDWGGEARGLVFARRAVELAATIAPAERAGIRDTLAWALFAVGRFVEAVAEEGRALEDSGPQQQAFYERLLAKLKAAIDEQEGADGARRLTELQDRIAALEAEVSLRLEWTFADGQNRWWHNQLEKLVLGLKAFSDPKAGLCSSRISLEHGWGVKKRLEFASTIGERSVTGPEASARWRDAIASIRDQCPRYEGLVIEPQLGLLPLGRDPDSGLWEFAHLPTGEPAVRSPSGKLVLEEDTGLVFVLLPGGTFTMGAQAKDPSAPNYDPAARADEVPRNETIAPFFLSKYEMTQAQWVRFVGRNPSGYGPQFEMREWGPGGEVWSGLHPVEQVTWQTCTDVLARLGLALPSEAQWEYGGRAGTSSVWWTGRERESLLGAANLADQAARRANAPWWDIEDWPELDDGYAVHAPVDRLRANPFGLHHVHGNVWEWCRDDYYRDGAQTDRSIERTKVSRGGSFHDPAVLARSAFRSGDSSGYAVGVIGLRPVCEIRVEAR